LFSGVGAALWILLFTLKSIQCQKAKYNVPHVRRLTKSMTGKTAEGLASGRALNTGGVWQNTFKINNVHFAKWQGLKPCGFPGGSLFFS
jgi:hypothetical protein